MAESIGDNLNGYKVIVTKSTVPVGTGQMVETHGARALGRRAGVRGGLEPGVPARGLGDRGLPATPTAWSSAPAPSAPIDVMLDIYAPLKAAGVPFVVANVESAEMIKYASNGFLATKISFINEVAEICEAVGADVEVVARGMGLDNRIGPKFLHPGPGFGGSCFPKDTRAVAQIAEEHGMRFEIIDAVLSANERVQAPDDRRRSTQAFGGLAGKTVARPRPRLQGRHRRHARVAGDPDHRGAGRARRDGSRLRPGGDGRQRDGPLLPPIAYCDDAYDAARGRRRRGHRHRVEPVPRARSRPAAARCCAAR